MPRPRSRFHDALEGAFLRAGLPMLGTLLAHSGVANQAGNLLLRATSLAARFLLILILARALGPREFGIFTLIQSTSIIAILVLGLEFNAFSRREIVIAKDSILRTRHVRDQITIACMMGLAAPLVAYGGVVAGLFPTDLALLVALVIFVELISQEGIRLLYALQRVLAGNIVWFVRTSIWVFLLLGMLALAPHTITLRNTLLIWVIFATISILVFAWSIRDLAWRHVLWPPKIDGQWIKHGIYIAMPFFISSLFINILGYLPRYILFYMRGAEETGIFGLYTGVAVGMVNLISTSVIPASTARAVDAHAHKGGQEFGAEIRKLWLQSASLALLLSLGLALFFPFILPFTGGHNYPMDWTLLLLVEVAYGAQVASLVSQVSLYAQHRDREILLGTVIAGSFSVALQFGGVLVAGMHGMAIAMSLSMLLLTALFLWFDRKTGRHSQGRGAV